jgi:hypothetical protein
MRSLFLFGIIAMALLIGVSCAKSDSPLQPSETQTTGSVASVSKDNNHYLWAYNLVSYDPATNDFEVVPLRTVADHWNVVKYLEKGPCTNCVTIKGTKKLINNNLLVTVQIKHPFPVANFTGFDVRGIAMFKGTQNFPINGLKASNGLKGEAELMNADGFTALYNPTTVGKGPGGLQGYLKGKMAAGLPDSTVNGFKMFNSPNPNSRNYFLAGASISSDFEIKLPTGVFVFGYAVDGSWVKPDVTPVTNPNTDFPDEANCSEPYSVKVFEDASTSTLTNSGGKTTLEIYVYDHQGKDSYKAPTVECSELFTGLTPATWMETIDDYDKWTVDINNSNFAAKGKYKVLVKVEDNDNDGSTDWLDLSTYQIATVQVTPETSLAGWAVTYGGSAWNTVFDSVTDSSGNVYVTGYFTGSTDFDPGPGEAILTVVGATDIYFAKYTASGAFVWAKSIGDDAADFGGYLAINGNYLLVYGSFQNSPDFDPGSGSDIHEAKSSHDCFLSEFDLDGKYKWTVTWAGNYPNGLQTDAAGNIYLGGRWDSYLNVDFDPGAGVQNLMAIGKYDGFLLKLNKNAQFVWVKQFSPEKLMYGFVTNIAVSQNGESWICGNYQGTADFNPGAGVDNHTSLGLYDNFVVHLDAGGNYVWGKSFGNPDTSNHDDECAAIAIDAYGNSYITGSFMDTVDFNPGSGINEITSYGARDVFLLKLDYAGNYVWSGSVGGPQDDLGRGIAVDSLGYIFFEGEFSGTSNLNPVPPGSASHKSEGFSDIFLVKLSSTFELQWADVWGGTGDDHSGDPGLYHTFGDSVNVDPYGKAYVGGFFRKTVDFDPGAGVDEHTATTMDAFITTIPRNGEW